MSMIHHGVSGHPSDNYYGCDLCTRPMIKALLAKISVQENKYEGYLQKLRADWTVDSEERNAYIEKLEISLSQEQARSRKYREALEEIEKMRGMTLLGRCCVYETCISDEEGTACEVTLKAHSAFGQVADVAKAALNSEQEVS